MRGLETKGYHSAQDSLFSSLCVEHLIDNMVQLELYHVLCEAAMTEKEIGKRVLKEVVVNRAGQLFGSDQPSRHLFNVSQV